VNSSGNNLKCKVRALQRITLGPTFPIIAVPTDITVHLGAPDEPAENVTIPFGDYIKNVASNELYPTWPESALEANIYAITSIAMNRIYTEWYRSRGYNFDITNSPQYDQTYVHNSGFYENIANIVNNILGHYIVKEGQIQPYFAQFCDGRRVKCDGLEQWGSVDLANQGYSAIDIIKYYYGEDAQIVTDAPITDIEYTYPGEPLMPGDSNTYIIRAQYMLDKISQNFPAIPKIESIDGYYGEQTEAAVKEFQRIFLLPVTGIIDEGTWYRIRRIYSSVTKLAELTGGGLMRSDLERLSSGLLLEGDVRPSVEIVQFALNVLAAYYPSIAPIPISQVFDENTRNAVIEFQKAVGLPPTGVADLETLKAMQEATFGILDTLPPEAVSIPLLRWTGVVYELGHQSPGVYLFQEMLEFISLVIPAIPYVKSTGIFDEDTLRAVIAFQTIEGLEPTGIVDEQTWNRIVGAYRRLRYQQT
jgi:peptidoglycan hydrolase-like protein with peptidoglycan-binding domain